MKLINKSNKLNFHLNFINQLSIVQQIGIYLCIIFGFSYFFLLSVYAGISFDTRNVFAAIINNYDGISTPFNIWVHRPIGYKIYIYLLSLIPGVHHYYYENNLIFVYLVLAGHNIIRLSGAYLITTSFVSNTEKYRQHLVFLTIYACTASMVWCELSLNAEDAAINIAMLSTGLLLRKNRFPIAIGAILMALLPYFKGITAFYAIPVFVLIFLYRKKEFGRLIILCGAVFAFITLLLSFFTYELKELFEMATYEGYQTLSILDRFKIMLWNQHHWIIRIPATAFMLALGYTLFVTIFEERYRSKDENSFESSTILFISLLICIFVPMIEIIVQGKNWEHNGVSAAIVAIAFVIIAVRCNISSVFMVLALIFMAIQATWIGLFFHNENGQFARDLQNMENSAEKVIEKDEHVLNLSFSNPYIAPLQIKRPSASRYTVNVPFDRLFWKEVDKTKLKNTFGYQYSYQFVKKFNGNFMVMKSLCKEDKDTFKLVESKIKSDYSRYFYINPDKDGDWDNALKIFIKNSYDKPIPADIKVHTFYKWP
ncbi:MAG: hypothetical protein AB7U45_04730 [Desulfamplus sp.]